MGKQLETTSDAQHVPLHMAQTTYRRVAADARTLSLFQLRWAYRRARRRATQSQHQDDLVTMRVLEHEFTARGLEPPT